MNTSYRRIVIIFFKYFKHVVVFSVALMIAAGGYGVGAKKYYRSKAKILVRLGMEQTGVADYIESASTVHVTRREQELRNELEILKSDWVLTRVADQIASGGHELEAQGRIGKFVETAVTLLRNLIQIDPRLDTTVADIKNYLEDHFVADALFESDTLELSLTFPDPLTAQTVLSMIIEQFIQQHIEVYNTSNELNFLEHELVSARSSYDELLEQFNGLKKSHGVFDDDTQIVLLLEKKDELEKRLSSSKADLEYYRQKVNRLRDLKNTIEPFETVSTVEGLNEIRQELKSQLVVAKIKKEKLLNHQQPESRFVKDIDNELLLIQKLLAEEPNSVVDSTDKRKNPVYETVLTNILNLESEIAGETAKASAIKQDLENTDERLHKFFKVQKDYTLLKKQVEFAKKKYEMISNGYIDTSLKNLIGRKNITNISIVERPSLPVSPYKPDMKRLAAAVLGILGFGNVFLIVLFSVLDNTINDSSDLPHILGVTPVGIIPYVQRSTEKQDCSRVSVFWGQCLLQFKNLLINLFFRDPENRVICIAKSCKGEGGTTIAYNLAIFMTRYQAMRVAMVDFSAKSPIGKNGQAGSDLEDAVQESEWMGVHIFKIFRDSEKEMKKIINRSSLIQDLRPKFDTVIINTPPVVSFPEIIFLQPHCGKVLLIAEAGKTTVRKLRETVSSLQGNGFKNIGIVLNKHREIVPSFLSRQE